MAADDAARATNDWNATIIAEFRANDGVVGGMFEGMPLVLLHTTGAKSGAARVNPVASLDFEGRRFVFASKAGADVHPDWFFNLKAHPTVTVEFGDEVYEATATELDEPERTRIYAEQASRYANFAEYADKTTRVIPVVELTRRP